MAIPTETLSEPHYAFMISDLPPERKGVPAGGARADANGPQACCESSTSKRCDSDLGVEPADARICPDAIRKLRFNWTPLLANPGHRPLSLDVAA